MKDEDFQKIGQIVETKITQVTQEVILPEIDKRISEAITSAVIPAMERLEDEMNSKFEIIDLKFEKIDSRFDVVDSRLDSIDRKLDRVAAQGLDHEGRIKKLESASPAHTN